MKNIKIAKELIKMAKNLLADDELVDNEGFFNKIKNETIQGFSKEVSQDEVKFIYNQDETESCYIIIDAVDDSDWQYVIYINEDEYKTVIKDTCEDAWNDLNVKIDGYMKKMDAFIEKMNSLEQEQQEDQQQYFGTYTCKKIKKNPRLQKLFRKQNSAFFDSAICLYKIIFQIDNQANKNKANKSILNIKQELSNLDAIFVKQTNSIYCTVVRKDDIKYVDGVLKEYQNSWSKSM